MPEPVRRPAPGSYSEMYKSRFLKADMFQGKKITLTIKAIFGEDLLSSEDETAKPEWIFQFQERPIEWVVNRTNCYCVYRMFSGAPQSWVGRKITLFAMPGKWFGEKTEAVRVWGSPELTEDIPITLKFLRSKRDRNMILHRVETKTGPQPVPQAPAPAQPMPSAVSERIVQIFLLLGWAADVQASWLHANSALSEADQVAKLEAILDT